MRHDLSALRLKIRTALPVGLVVPEHTEKEHFYRIHQNLGGVVYVTTGDPAYPSVTGKLQHLKDEGLANFKMNRALEYIFANFAKFTEANIMEHIAAAERMPADIFEDAGDIGTYIHDLREEIFSQWIETGTRPPDFESFIHADRDDIRAHSALAALSKFCDEWNYIPVMTELYVYSHGLKTAGALDDLGLIRQVVREGDTPCAEHDVFQDPNHNIDRCLKCGAKWKWLLVLMDLKSSNRFKDSYFFQVSMYYEMFRKLTNIKLDMAFILKVSKDDRTYKIEDLKRPAKLAQYAKHIIKTNDGLAFIKELRKDNQRNVVRL